MTNRSHDVSPLKRVYGIVKQTVSEFIRDDAITLAAALSFYSALSFGPLLVLLLWAGGMMGEGGRAQVIDQVRAVIGPQAGEMVNLVLENTDRTPGARTLAGIIGLLTLVLSATGAFAQLQYSLNRIWNVRVKPGRGLWNWFRKRLLSLGMIITMGFLLLVSLGVSAGLAGFVTGDGVVWRGINMATSLMVFSALFAVMFKYLPDVKLAWRDVWVGALITALLFALGKYAIGLYLGRSSVGSTYGAAGTLLMLLLWVYFTSIIVLLGAEATQVYARCEGRGMEPAKYAVWIDSDKVSVRCPDDEPADDGSHS